MDAIILLILIFLQIQQVNSTVICAPLFFFF